MIKLIASDMDGTLLDENGNVPEEFFDILDRLNRKGIKFAVASGRSYKMLYNNFSKRPDDIIYISDNGTYVVDKNEVILKNVLDRKTVLEATRICDEMEDAKAILCGINIAYTKAYSEEFVSEFAKYYVDNMVLDSFENLDGDVLKIGIYDKKGAFHNSYPVMNKRFGDRLKVVVSGHHWTDIMNADANKGEALGMIQKRFGISPDETMAFGDFYNDIEMLKLARYSFVMANANDDMKHHGNYIAESNRNYGVIKAIKQYVLN